MNGCVKVGADVTFSVGVPQYQAPLMPRWTEAPCKVQLD